MGLLPPQPSSSLFSLAARVSCLNLVIVPSLRRTCHGSPLPAGYTQDPLGQAPISLSSRIPCRALPYSPGESLMGDYVSHGPWLDLWPSVSFSFSRRSAAGPGACMGSQHRRIARR